MIDRAVVAATLVVLACLLWPRRDAAGAAAMLRRPGNGAEGSTAMLPGPGRDTASSTAMLRGLVGGAESLAGAGSGTRPDGARHPPAAAAARGEVHSGPGSAGSPAAGALRLARRLRSVTATAAAATWTQLPWTRTARQEEETTAVLEILDAVSPALAAGLAPVAALRLVEGSPRRGYQELVGRLVAAADAGAPLAPVWRERAGALRSPELALVAAAWSLCESLGSPLAPTVTTVAGLVRQRQSIRRRTDAALAGPRATMAVLAALPVTGPAIAFFLGIPPGDLLGTAPAMASVGCGLLLLLLGRWWCRRLIGSMTRERRRPPGSRR